MERFGRPDGYAERQVRRWSGQWEIVGDPALGQLATDLARRLAAANFDQRSTGVVHGDYRIDNTLLSFGAGGPRVEAVVDWELSTIGDPVADVALMCVYRHPALDLVLGFHCAWTSDRLPDTDALAAAYEAAGGVALMDWDKHLCFGHFKLAVIAAGMDHRYRAGATQGDGPIPPPKPSSHCSKQDLNAYARPSSVPRLTDNGLQYPRCLHRRGLTMTPGLGVCNRHAGRPGRCWS